MYTVRHRAGASASQGAQDRASPLHGDMDEELLEHVRETEYTIRSLPEDIDEELAHFAREMEESCAPHASVNTKVAFFTKYMTSPAFSHRIKSMRRDITLEVAFQEMLIDSFWDRATQQLARPVFIDYYLAMSDFRVRVEARQLLCQRQNAFKMGIYLEIATTALKLSVDRNSFTQEAEELAIIRERSELALQAFVEVENEAIRTRIPPSYETYRERFRTLENAHPNLAARIGRFRSTLPERLPAASSDRGTSTGVAGSSTPNPSSRTSPERAVSTSAGRPIPPEQGVGASSGGAATGIGGGPRPTQHTWTTRIRGISNALQSLASSSFGAMKCASQPEVGNGDNSPRRPTQRRARGRRRSNAARAEYQQLSGRHDQPQSRGSQPQSIGSQLGSQGRSQLGSQGERQPSSGGERPLQRGGSQPRSQGRSQLGSQGERQPSSGGERPLQRGGSQPRSQGGSRIGSQGRPQLRSQGERQPLSGGERPSQSGGRQPQSQEGSRPYSGGRLQPQSEGRLQPQSAGERQPQSLGRLQPRSEGGSRPQSGGEGQPQSSAGLPPRSVRGRSAQSGENQPQNVRARQPQSGGEIQPQSGGGHSGQGGRGDGSREFFLSPSGSPPPSLR